MKEKSLETTEEESATSKRSFTEENPSDSSSSRKYEISEKERIISTEISSYLDLFPSSSDHSEIKSHPSFEIASDLASSIDSNGAKSSDKLQDSSKTHKFDLGTPKTSILDYFEECTIKSLESKKENFESYDFGIDHHLSINY